MLRFIQDQEFFEFGDKMIRSHIGKPIPAFAFDPAFDRPLVRIWYMTLMKIVDLLDLIGNFLTPI